MEAHVKCESLPDVCDANGKLFSTIATLKIPIRLGRFLSLLEVLVFEHLATLVILGTDHFHRFVEAILPRRKCFELDDGTTVPILRLPLKPTAKEPKLPAS